MKFRIIKCVKNNYTNYQVEILYYFLFGLYKKWIPLQEHGQIIEFFTIEQAVDYIKKKYTRPKKSVVKEITHEI